MLKKSAAEPLLKKTPPRVSASSAVSSVFAEPSEPSFEILAPLIEAAHWPDIERTALQWFTTHDYPVNRQAFALPAHYCAHSPFELHPEESFV